MRRNHVGTKRTSLVQVQSLNIHGVCDGTGPTQVQSLNIYREAARGRVASGDASEGREAAARRNTTGSVCSYVAELRDLRRLSASVAMTP